MRAGTETSGGDLGGAGEGLVGEVLKKISHNLVEDGGGTGHAGGHIAHRCVVVVANPDDSKIRGGVADGPVVAFVIGGAGFNRNMGMAFND